MTHLMSIAARIAVGGLGLLLPVAGLAQTSTSAINGTIQDTWRVSDKLTFNWGLRFDDTLIPVYGNAKDNNDEVGDMDLVFGRYILEPAYLTNLVRGLILRQGKPWPFTLATTGAKAWNAKPSYNEYFAMLFRPPAAFPNPCRTSQ